jgi:hypothetical protein
MQFRHESQEVVYTHVAVQRRSFGQETDAGFGLFWLLAQIEAAHFDGATIGGDRTDQKL